jgi:nucleotide-binding universal stress UspA family protein
MAGATAPKNGDTAHRQLGAIAAAFDGTPAAWRAALHAADLARWAGARLELLRVLDRPGCDGNGPRADGARRARLGIIDELVRAVASVGAAVEAEAVVLYGDPVHELVRASSRFDLMVVGAGSGGTPRARRGSVSAAVAASAACEVVLVRDKPAARARRSTERERGSSPMTSGRAPHSVGG